jgi:predicted sulfurtransferase
MKKNMIAIGVAVVGLSALMFAGVAAMRGGKATKPAVTMTVSTMTSLESVPRISVAALKEKIDRGEVVVMDVRDIDSYTASHIAGAMHIPVSYVASELPYLPRGKPIVAYCT